MTEKSEPEIKKYSGADFTCITFKPDLKRFKMDFLDDDIISLLSKRVYDIAGTTTAGGARLNVFLNGSKIDIRNFEQVNNFIKCQLKLITNVVNPVVYICVSWLICTLRF
jgi:DNA topoisomerase-2